MEKFIEDHKSILAVQSFLKWCYNFRQEDIEILCSKSREFKNVWEKYILPSAEGSMTIDYLVIVDNLFSKVSFKTLKIVIDFAMERYEIEEANRLDFALEIQRKQEEMMNEKESN